MSDDHRGDDHRPKHIDMDILDPRNADGRAAILTIGHKTDGIAARVALDAGQVAALHHLCAEALAYYDEDLTVDEHAVEQDAPPAGRGYE